MYLTNDQTQQIIGEYLDMTLISLALLWYGSVCHGVHYNNLLYMGMLCRK